MRAVVVVVATVALMFTLACGKSREEKKKEKEAQTKDLMALEAKARADEDARLHKQALDEATAACNADKPEGCVALGRVHKTGPDAQAAFAKACKLKSKDGCRQAAADETDGVKKLDFMKSLCALDDADACIQGAALADTLIQNKLLPEPKKPAERDAITLLKKACDLGGAIACTARGVALINDDPPAALQSLLKGCDANEPTACFQAAEMLAAGKGQKKKDPAKAAALKKKACAAGLKEAC